MLTAPKEEEEEEGVDSPAEVVALNSTGGMDVCLLWVLCVVRYRSLRGVDHSSRTVLSTAVRRCVRSRNIITEEALAHLGLSHQKQTNIELFPFTSALEKIKTSPVPAIPMEVDVRSF
jgi:hypothetical protein